MRAGRVQGGGRRAEAAGDGGEVARFGGWRGWPGREGMAGAREGGDREAEARVGKERAAALLGEREAVG